MIVLRANSINVVKYRDADVPFVAVRGEDEAILICSAPVGGGLYPHSIIYNEREDSNEVLNEVVDIAAISVTDLNNITSDVPTGYGFFILFKDSILRIGYRIIREYDGVEYPTSCVAIIEYTDSVTTHMPVIQMHVDDLKDFHFADFNVYLERDYNYDNKNRLADNKGIIVRTWSRDLDSKYEGKTFASDMLKEILLCADYYESIKYLESNIEPSMLNIYERRRIVGESSDIEAEELYQLRSKKAAEYLWINNRIRDDALIFFDYIGYSRHDILSKKGLDYLRNLWLTSDRYINDLGL